jgi:DNA-binding response OmpR family regulator
MVRQLIHRLRVKIDKEFPNQINILNVPGLGYELKLSEDNP